MPEISIRRKDDQWRVLLNGQDVTTDLIGFIAESDRAMPWVSPRVTLQLRPGSLVLEADDAQVERVEWHGDVETGESA